MTDQQTLQDPATKEARIKFFARQCKVFNANPGPNPGQVDIELYSAELQAYTLPQLERAFNAVCAARPYMPTVAELKSYFLNRAARDFWHQIRDAIDACRGDADIVCEDGRGVMAFEQHIGSVDDWYNRHWSIDLKEEEAFVHAYAACDYVEPTDPAKALRAHWLPVMAADLRYGPFYTKPVLCGHAEQWAQAYRDRYDSVLEQRRAAAEKRRAQEEQNAQQFSVVDVQKFLDDYLKAPVFGTPEKPEARA